MSIELDNIAALVARAEAAANPLADPEAAVHAVVGIFFDTLGDRTAHHRPQALAEGQTQFFVAGAFLATPDRNHLMLVGNIGFPPEQKRLLVPIDGGNPGQVIASGQALLLEDTTTRSDFRQYLQTARMGSAIYAPLLVDGVVIGLIIMAAQARWTMTAHDLAALEALAPLVARIWVDRGGPDWLTGEAARMRN